MTSRHLLATVALALALVLGSSGSAAAGPTVVGTSRAGIIGMAIGLNDLKPDDCAALALTTLVTGSGNFTGTAANDLMLASVGADTAVGGGGDDCILGGGGDDTLRGGAGVDVCVGGPGNDSFTMTGANACEVVIQ